MNKRDLEAVEIEIQREKAESLGKAGERLEQALLKLQALQDELSDLLAAAEESACEGKKQASSEWDRKWIEYAGVRQQARALRHALIIQREAVGLWRHEDVDRQYPLPPMTRLMARYHGGNP